MRSLHSVSDITTNNEQLLALYVILLRFDAFLWARQVKICAYFGEPKAGIAVSFAAAIGSSIYGYISDE